MPSPIIVYIHVCQVGEWTRSFQMIMDAIRKSGLYWVATEIRLGILAHDKVDMTDLEDPKFRVIYEGRPEEYERPTLLHMKRSTTDPLDTRYFYCHTKGVRWFGTPTEQFVVDWINLLIYWNIEQWNNAEDILGKYDTYGCNYHGSEKYPPHYSGNFFWTTPHHLKTLPDTIGPEYNDPEFWLCSGGLFGGRPNSYCAFNSNMEGMGHYGAPFPESLYRK